MKNSIQCVLSAACLSLFAIAGAEMLQPIDPLQARNNYIARECAKERSGTLPMIIHLPYEHRFKGPQEVDYAICRLPQLVNR